MNTGLKNGLRRIANSLGYEVARKSESTRGVTAGPCSSHGDEDGEGTAGEFPDDFLAVYELVKPYTMTSRESVNALCESVKYVVQSDLPGDIVECGVWKGGSVMAAARTLQQLGSRREIHLFDTFAGMPPPTEADVDYRGVPAAQSLAVEEKTESHVWAYSPLEEVRRNIELTGYDRELIRFVPGRVEETIPANAPAEIALLRLDTDWYESTRHELEHLYPRLCVGGVLIIDDYGHWQGAKRAVDEYVAEHKLKLLLNRVNYTCRLAVKTAA